MKQNVNKKVIIHLYAKHTPIIEFDLDSYEWSIKKSSNAHINGYGDFYDINGVEKLVIILGWGNTIYFFCDSLIDLAQDNLSASIHSKWFLKNKFVLRSGGGVLINVTYKKTEIESDIFMDVVDYLKIKPFEERLKKITRMVNYYKN